MGTGFAEVSEVWVVVVAVVVSWVEPVRGVEVRVLLELSPASVRLGAMRVVRRVVDAVPCWDSWEKRGM